MRFFGYWQLGRLHKIESEDCYSSGATGVIQASTALWPEYPERLEIHGTKGSAVVVGDQLTTCYFGATAPVSLEVASGASDPTAISTIPFERQFDFGEACKAGRPPACSGRDGFRALQVVGGIYTS